MKTTLPSSRIQPRVSAGAGYLLIEALVYISVLFVVLGAGYLALYRFMDHSVALRHNADDITATLHAGELWRADVRSSTNASLSQATPKGPVLTLQTPERTVDYQFADHTVFRRINSGVWTRLLANVKSSRMTPEPRKNVNAWSWELELQPRIKTKAPPRIRPLFTFLAAPKNQSGL